MRRTCLPLVVTGALLLPASPALGHAELIPYQLPPGTTSDIAIVLSHGCGDDDEWLSSEPQDDPPTTGVTLQVPPGVQAAPYAIEGWQVTVDGDDQRIETIRWELEDPAGTTETVALPFSVTLPDGPSGTQLWLPIVQDCVGGEQLSWTEEGEIRGGDAVPALRLFLNENSAPSDLSNLVEIDREQGLVTDPVVESNVLGRRLPAFGLALAGLGALVVAAVRRRRRLPAAG
ncbi:DUF1775 domain-containing protein [Egicoccus sp. AB-alg2]|uniref:DUF1775 domain-containing protein n=1 Tax=Egicoccus sp. AB-alg2 TaxID=3242693 RepID=UPI00359D42C7